MGARATSDELVAGLGGKGFAAERVAIENKRAVVSFIAVIGGVDAAEVWVECGRDEVTHDGLAVLIVGELTMSGYVIPLSFIPSHCPSILFIVLR